MPNLNDFNQRVNSDAKCNQHCAELHTNQMFTETDMAMEVEKNSLSPNVPNESGLQVDQSDTSVTSFVSHGGETKNENLTLSEKSSQLLSHNIPLTGKPSKKSQFCENSNDIGRLKTNFPGSKALEPRESHQSKIEIDVLPVTSQLSECQDNSSLQSISVSVESSVLNVSEQGEVGHGDSISSIKQASNDSSCIELDHTGHENQPSKSDEVVLDSQEPSSSAKEDGNGVFLSLDENENCGEVVLMPPEGNLVEERHSLPSEPVCSSVVESHPESQNTSDKPASNNSTEIDASNIVSLKIIISDDSFVSSETELNTAVSSISGENVPTIILSSAKSPAKNAELVKCVSSEETAGAITSAEATGNSASMEQSLLVLKPGETAVNNTQSEDSIAFPASVTPCASKDGGYIQLMPATSTTFGSSNNILIATCMTDPTALGTTVSQSSVVVLPGNSAPRTSAQPSPSQLQTPPRSNSVFAVNQAVSPNFSQGNFKNTLKFTSVE